MMSISFYVCFTDERSCRLHFKSLRDEVGVVCKSCGSEKHYWLKNKWSYECKNCLFRTSLRTGTIMENSKLPFIEWYKAIFLVTVTKRNISAKKIQKLLHKNSYQPIWNMVNVLKGVTTSFNDEYILERIVKENKDFFTLQILNSSYKNYKMSGNIPDDELEQIIQINSEAYNKGEKGQKGMQYFFALINTEENYTSNNDSDKSFLDISNYVELSYKAINNPSDKLERKNQVIIKVCNNDRRLPNNLEIITEILLHEEIRENNLQRYLTLLCKRLNSKYFNESVFDSIILNYLS